MFEPLLNDPESMRNKADIVTKAINNGQSLLLELLKPIFDRSKVL